ncbi:hypothetical protein WMY93_033166 [Mugilogobius chulae]|uniref:Uncharacterized protein n=1 Tax=Mugilogobius chulae TaxID=88201 RepID=A0AAW0MHN5_9GOBI
MKRYLFFIHPWTFRTGSLGQSRTCGAAVLWCFVGAGIKNLDKVVSFVAWMSGPARNNIQPLAHLVESSSALLNGPINSSIESRSPRVERPALSQRNDTHSGERDGVRDADYLSRVTLKNSHQQPRRERNYSGNKLITTQKRHTHETKGN